MISKKGRSHPRAREKISDAEKSIEKTIEYQVSEKLETERQTLTRLWVKRKAQIQGVIESSAGMYGDLQRIAGQEIREIEGLELAVLESTANETPVSSKDAW